MGNNHARSDTGPATNESSDYGPSEGQEVEFGHLMQIGGRAFAHTTLNGYRPAVQGHEILYHAPYFNLILDEDSFTMGEKFIKSSMIEVVTTPYAQDHDGGSSMPSREIVEDRVSRIVDIFNSHIKSQTSFSLQQLKDAYDSTASCDAEKLQEGYMLRFLRDTPDHISPSDIIIETDVRWFAYPGDDLPETALYTNMREDGRGQNFDPGKLSACTHRQVTMSLELDCHYTWNYPEALNMEEKMWMLEEAVNRINRLLGEFPGKLDITSNIEYALINCALACISTVLMNKRIHIASLPQDQTFLINRSILHDIKNQIFTHQEKSQLEEFYAEHSEKIAEILGEGDHIFQRNYDPVSDLFAKDEDLDWEQMRHSFHVSYEMSMFPLQEVAEGKYAPLVELRWLPNCTGDEVYDPSGFWPKQHQEISDFQQGRYRSGSLLTIPACEKN